MENFCTYCNSLHRAIKEYNYCSIKGDNINEVPTNAYYFESNKLDSGSHISRFSIRTISDGYQNHFVNNKDFILDNNHYLVTNEGDTFSSNIETNIPVEGLLVAFSQIDLDNIHNYAIQTESKLLDDPFNYNRKINSLTIETRKHEIGSVLKKSLFALKSKIKNKNEGTLYFEELFQSILDQVIKDQKHLEKRIIKITSKKLSTKKEIHKRIELAKEFIESNLKKNITLKELSNVATLSSFHFLRSFSEFYNITPYQYLKKKRLEKAKFLLRDTYLNLDEITKTIGFKDKSSFVRLFKKSNQQTPIQYRLSHEVN